MAICSTLKSSLHDAPTTTPLFSNIICANAENAPPDELSFSRLQSLCMNAYDVGLSLFKFLGCSKAGQTATHLPHLIQLSSSTYERYIPYSSPLSLIAFAGHTEKHAPHPTHFSIDNKLFTETFALPTLFIISDFGVFNLFSNHTLPSFAFFSMISLT